MPDPASSLRAHLPAAALTLVLVVLAVGRQRALEPLSPPDLAFFHQTTWSATQGLGFAQTALPFEGQGLLECIHLSLVRALWVPVYALVPRVETLVAIQALAIGLSAGLAGALCRAAGGKGWLPLVAVGLVALHPMSVGLATADVRPIVWMAPGLLAVLLGLEQRRAWVVGLGALVVIAAREEACWVLGALLPWAALRIGRAETGERRPAAWSAGVLLLGTAVALALPLLAWGHLSNVQATTDHGMVLTGILEGSRSLLRDPWEARFGLLSLGLALPALAAPAVFLPGLAAWLYLAIFSGLEVATTGEPGVHYLGVVQPFLLGAAALGLGRLGSRRGMQLGGLALILASIGVSLWLLPGAPRWAVAALSPTAEAQPLHRLAAPVLAHEGGVVAEPRLAPVLAGRRIIHVRGNLYAERGKLGALTRELDWALLDVDGARAKGRPAEERRWWREALEDAGLERQEVRGGHERWGR